MKILLSICILLTTTVFAQESNTLKEKMNPYGYYFESSSGLVNIEMGALVEKNKSGLHDVIVIMHGFSAYAEGVNKQALYLHAVSAGQGFNLINKKDGKDKIIITSRKGWGNWDNLVAYLGGEEISIYENSKKSKAVKPLHLNSALTKILTKSDKYDVNPYGLFYSSSDGSIKMEMAVFNEANKNGLKDVLLKISGRGAFDTGIEGKTIKYIAANGGLGVNYQYKTDKGLSNRMITRKNWSWENREIYLGKKSYKMHINASKSKSVRPIHLLTAFKKEN